jgi:hypothetical protein
MIISFDTRPQGHYLLINHYLRVKQYNQARIAAENAV